MVKLLIKQAGQSREVVLSKDNFSIGRTPENDLEIRDALISRRHSSIIRREDRYVLYDLGSSNGTYVNRARVETKPLDHGDIIRVGDTEITYFDENSSRKAGTRPVAARGVALPGSEPLGGGQLVQHVDNIAEKYSFDISDVLSKGLSLKSIRPESKGEQAAKESKMFFILFQVGKSLSSAPSLNDMLGTAIKLIFEVINAERCVILYREGAEGDAVPRVAYHRDRGLTDPASIPISKTITNQVMGDKISIITSDALSDPRFAQGMSIIQYNIRSALCVPLWEENRVYGAIYLDNLAKSYAFTKEDLELLTAIANLIAIRIRSEEVHAKLRKEEMARTNLSKFHSPDVVELIMARGEEMVHEVSEREVTAVFIDIVGSTDLAETKDAKTVAGLMNDFFKMAAEGVFAFKGHLNKFIGDEVLAFYNATVDMPAHAEAAIRTCLKVLEDMRKFNEAYPDKKFDLHVGVNTGPVIWGYMGAPTRMEYTALGDTVNVAARLSKLPQLNAVIVGERTHSLVKDLFKSKDLGEVVLKGKGKPLRAYEILP